MNTSNYKDDLNFNVNLQENNSSSIKVNQPGHNKNNNTNINYNTKEDNKEKIDITNFLSHANHPFVVIFTLLFKVASILM